MRLAAAAFAALVAASTAAYAGNKGEPQLWRFGDLVGWAEDDHGAALAAFTKTCGDLRATEWRGICMLAGTGPDAKWFFETFFSPVLIDDGAQSLVTGYYEPELAGARQKSARYATPVYSRPPELGDGALWHDRQIIETGGLLAGRGLELAWVDDPAALFYLQVQGSGRIRFDDGSILRLGYAGTNGHPYRSPGDELVRRGIYQPHQASAEVVGNWVRRNPAQGIELLRGSPNYVFFRAVSGLDPTQGPKGAMNRPITAGRALAVDPNHIPLGAPVWIEKGGADIIRRLMVAQDTGSAIKGAQRADFFTGTGEQAGKMAARLHDPACLIVLMPIDLAIALTGG